jgi:hypothetical protein
LQDKHLFEMKAENLQKVAFNTGKQTYAFERKPAGGEGASAPAPDDWQMEGDAQFPLDKGRANSTVNNLIQIQWAEVIEQPQSPAEYGLDKPVATLEFISKNGEMKKLLFGGADDKNQMIYASVAGDPKVYQVRKFNYDRLLKEKAFYKGDPNAAAPAPGGQMMPPMPSGGGMQIPGGMPMPAPGAPAPKAPKAEKK